jgi:hypothetical protein
MAPNCIIGSAPLNLLPCTKNTLAFFNADIEAGRLPVRELLPTLKPSMSTNALAASTTEPMRFDW